MSYKRKATRPMRTIEENAVTTERDELQERVDHLKAQNLALSQALQIRTLEAEFLFEQKIRLINDLREASTKIDFLEGRGFRSKYDFRRWLPGWNERRP